MTAHETTNGATIQHAIGADGTFTLRVASWDVDLSASADDTARVRALSGALPADIEVERGEGTLTVRQPMRAGLGGLLSGRNHDVRLGVEVPRGASVDIQTASGDISATGLARNQLVRSASGDVRITGAAGTVGVESMSGDVGIQLAAAAKLTVRSVSGDVAIRGGRADDVAITTTSGDIRLLSELGPGPHAIATVSGDAELLAGTGVRVTARTVAGDLQTRLPHTTQGGPGRRSLVVGDGAIEVEFKSVSGDLQVLGAADARGVSIGTIPAVPQPPEPPQVPERPAASPAPTPAAADLDAGAGESGAGESATAARDEALRLTILQALERSEIGIEEAGARLAALDGQADD